MDKAELSWCVKMTAYSLVLFMVLLNGLALTHVVNVDNSASKVTDNVHDEMKDIFQQSNSFLHETKHVSDKNSKEPSASQRPVIHQIVSREAIENLKNAEDRNMYFKQQLNEELNIRENDKPGIEIRKLLRSCEDPKSMKCETKLDLSLRLLNDKKIVDGFQYILVNTVFNETTGELVYLKNPIILQIKQEPVTIAYPLEFIQSVNSKSYEVVINKDVSKNFTGCLDQQAAEKLCTTLAHGPIYNTADIGYCCSCSDDSVHSRQMKCTSKEPSDHTSVHCLRFSPLWYSVLALNKPYIFHALRIRVYTQVVDVTADIKVQWQMIGKSDLIVGSTKTKDTSADGTVWADYMSLTDLDDKDVSIDTKSTRILFPEPIHSLTHHPLEELKGGYLMVNEKDISLDGTECDKIGFSYNGFMNEESRCLKPPQSCLNNQPKDLWLLQENHFYNTSKDIVSQRMDFKMSPILHNLLNHSDELHVPYNHIHVDIVTVSINTSEVNFIYPGSSAEILSVIVSKLATAGKKDETELSILLQSTDRVSASFSVRLVECSPSPIYSSQHGIKIDPQETVLVTFLIDGLTSLHTSTNQSCSVQVLNVMNETILMKPIWFVFNERCYCLLDCDCQCGIPIAPTCHPVDEISLSMPILTRNLLIIMLPLAASLILGFLKAIYGLLAFPELEYFGYGMFFASPAPQPSYALMFILNVFFVILAPFLLIIFVTKWIVNSLCSKSATTHGESTALLVPPAAHEQAKTETVQIDDASKNTESVELEESGGVNYSHNDVKKEKKLLMSLGERVIKDEEMMESSFASRQNDSILELTAPGQLVFCDFDKEHPGLINSGPYFSLCGTLKKANSNLYVFSNELSQTQFQIYENNGGHIRSLLSLNPLEQDLFTQILTREEVFDRISKFPKYPCLNKVLTDDFN